MTRGALPDPGDTFGRYEVVRRIGRGGMGSVYEARQLDLGRAVALKVLSPELADDPVFRARFTREARMLAALDSPHVIQVLETGDHDGALYIATQLVHGRDLMQLLRQEGPLPAPVALKVVAQVAAALGDAHAAGLLHRDVKPSNVLVRESRSDVFAYLCDFGIARQTVSTHTQTHGVLGTYHYMAPECHTGDGASVASDIYSLGCVLWAALSGSPPYERTSEFQIALAHVSDEIPTYAGSSPARDAVNEILRRSMAKAPADRYSSAAEMLDALLAAEIQARGLRATDEELTAMRGAISHQEHTILRPKPDLASAPTTEMTEAPRDYWPVLVVGLATLAAVLALGGAAFALFRPDETPQANGQRAADPSSTRRADTRATPTPVVPTKEAPAVSGEGPLGPAPTSAAGAVTCWDGSSAAAPAACPPPSGLEGMRAVFPSLGPECSSDQVQVPGKVELFVCNYGSFAIRYSRWQPDFDKYELFDTTKMDPISGKWIVDQKWAGRTWTSYETKIDPNKPYQWTAAYRFSPFSVSVEATSNETRKEGKASVLAKAPDLVRTR